jgi:hypothetical protein
LNANQNENGDGQFRRRFRFDLRVYSAATAKTSPERNSSFKRFKGLR